MGQEILVPLAGSAAQAASPLSALLTALGAAEFPTTVMMVDGALVFPTAAPPSRWRDVRLRTPAGTVTLSRRADAIAVVVFGNATPDLVAAQTFVAETLRLLPA